MNAFVLIRIVFRNLLSLQMIPDRFYLVYTLIVLQGISVQCRKRGHIKPHEIDENLLSQRCELLCLLRTQEKVDIWMDNKPKDQCFF